MMNYSIVICCYNSAERLPEALRHIASLDVAAGMQVEVIVVDNASTDATEAVARESWKKYQSPFPLKVIQEKKAGLSAARTRGIGEACYEYILFCDDDNWLSPGYLLQAEAVLHNERVGLLGGLGEPVYPALPPHWPERFYLYGCGPQGEGDGVVQKVYGAGAILRRSAFEKLQKAGFVFMLSDRQGDNLFSGGDYELCYALKMAGYEIVFRNGLKFKHLIPPLRLSVNYCRKFIQDSAPMEDVVSSYAFLTRDRHPSLARYYLERLHTLLHHVKEMVRQRIARIKYRRYPQPAFYASFKYRYHRTRVCCMIRSAGRYGEYYNRAFLLGKRLQELNDPASAR